MSKVDHNAIKFNQVSLTIVAVAALFADLPWLVGVLALVLAASTAWPQWGLFRVLYQRVAVPLRLLRPNLREDEQAPHRFSQGVGAAFLAFSWISLQANAIVLGWALNLLVAVLAMVNVLLNFCVGCFVYYQLRRVGLIKQQAEAK